MGLLPYLTPIYVIGVEILRFLKETASLAVYCSIKGALGQRPNQRTNQCEYKLKRCTNKECCKQCRHGMFEGTMTKWPVQKLAQGTTQKLLQHHDATDI